jgi:hypothetical protein
MKVTGETFSFILRRKGAEEARYILYPNFQANGLLPDRTLESFIKKSTDGAIPNLFFRNIYGVRSCNITKDMLYWPHDQTITYRICREQFITSTSRGNAKQVILLLEKDFTDFLRSLG